MSVPAIKVDDDDNQTPVPATQDRPVSTGNPQVEDVDLPKVVAHIGQQIGELSVNVASMSGTVGDVSQDLTGQLKELEDVASSVKYIAEQNSVIAKLANEANQIASRVGDGLENTVSSIEETFSKSVEDIHAMASSSDKTHLEFGTVKSKLDEVYGFSQSITRISSETQFLAINAGILAANTGDAGKGFAVIAESIRELAQETSKVSKSIVTQLDHLKDTFDSLASAAETSNAVAGEAVVRTNEIENQIDQFREFGREVSTLTNHIVEVSEPIEKNSVMCSQVASQAVALTRASTQNSTSLKKTFEQFDQLVSFSEEMILLVERSGIETRDTPIIKLCSGVAHEIEKLFEQAVVTGQISISELFDEDYREIPGSNPLQHSTKFLDFTDRVLPPIQETVKDAHPRIVFAAAVDRNGYLPTHNKMYSHPQSDDPVWNAGNCRNRRIFNDRTGAAAGANTKAFLMQTYRRDMGGGEYALMKDLSVPIRVQSRHWGGFRMGVSV